MDNEKSTEAYLAVDELTDCHSEGSNGFSGIKPIARQTSTISAESGVITEEESPPPRFQRIKRTALTAIGPLLASFQSPSGERQPWQAAVLRFGPLSGIVAIVLALSSTVASVGVLIGSNGTPTNDWITPPSTYLAIFTAIANLSIRYATFQGVIIAWWRKAIGGSSLSSLHYDWYSGTSIRGAITAGRRTTLLGLACIVSTLVVVDGPLLQRASDVRQAPFNTPLSLNVTMAPQLPTDFTGYWIPPSDVPGSQHEDAAFNATIPVPNGTASNFVGALQNGNQYVHDAAALWGQNASFPNVVRGCSGQCSARIIAPALAQTDCVTHTMPVDYWKVELQQAYLSNAAFPWESELFAIQTALVFAGDQEAVNVVWAHSTTENCTGVLEWTICTLRSAIAEYNVTVSGEEMTLDPQSALSPNIIAIADNAAKQTTLNSGQISGTINSTLGGVVADMNNFWNNFVVAAYTDGGIEQWDFGQATTVSMAIANDQSNGCFSYINPRDQYMASVNRYMVSLGMFAGRGLGDPRLDTLDPRFPINTTTTGYSYGTQPTYHTEYRFFVAAIIIEAFCVCLILPTYWGWWRLGRSVSFSPLEIAKAFGAPILADINSNSSGREIAYLCDGRDIQYGSSTGDRHRGHPRLAFLDPASARYPQAGEVFTD